MWTFALTTKWLLSRCGFWEFVSTTKNQNLILDAPSRLKDTQGSQDGAESDPRHPHIMNLAILLKSFWKMFECFWLRVAEDPAAQHNVPNARKHTGQTDAGMPVLYTSCYMRAQASFFFHCRMCLGKLSAPLPCKSLSQHMQSRPQLASGLFSFVSVLLSQMQAVSMSTFHPGAQV